MVDGEPPMVPTRGSNPAPAGGWSWNLTDYEVGYLRAFNVRPVRDGWPGTAEENSRLDQEADGVRLRPLPPTLLPPPLMRPRRRHQLVLWASVAGVIVLSGAAAAVLGVMNVNAAADLNEDTTRIEADL